MKGQLCGVNQTGYLFLAEDLWKVNHLLRIGGLGNAPASLQYLNIKETQGCHRWVTVFATSFQRVNSAA